MIRNRKGMNIKFLVLSIGLIIIVLVILYMMLSIVVGGALETREEGAKTECEKQEDEESCLELKTENWIGEKRNKCFWDEETDSCGKMVHAQ